MAVPSSGELKLWDNIWNLELNGSQGQNSLHSASVYAGFSTPDAMSDFYGWSDVEPPSIVTNNAASVTDSSMNLRGTVTNTGNEAVCRGFYHGGNPNAYNCNTKYTLAGTQATTGEFTCNRTGLGYNTTYYFWAFGCNSAGTTIGSRLQSTTNLPPFSPAWSCFSPRGTMGSSSQYYGSGFSWGHFAYQNPYSGAYVQTGNCYTTQATQNGWCYADNTYNKVCTFICSQDGYFGAGITGWIKPQTCASTATCKWNTNCYVYGSTSLEFAAFDNYTYCIRALISAGPGQSTTWVCFRNCT